LALPATVPLYRNQGSLTITAQHSSTTDTQSALIALPAFMEMNSPDTNLSTGFLSYVSFLERPH